MNQKLMFPYRVSSATPAVMSSSARTVTVATDGQLMKISCGVRLAMCVVARGISRRRFGDDLALVIYSFEGVILWPNGSRFEITDTLIDDVFGDDQDFRWLSDFLKWPVHPPCQRPQKKILPRLRVIDLYFRINNPERAELIAK